MLKLFVLPLFLAAVEQSFEGLQCDDCLAADGMQCLIHNEYTMGLCCHREREQQSPLCRYNRVQVLCSTQQTNAQELKDFTCPADRQHCPQSLRDVEVWLDEAEQIVSRTYNWPMTQSVPDESAREWHCKYRVSTSRLLIASKTAEQPAGKMVLQPIMQGFTGKVDLIVQPH